MKCPSCNYVSHDYLDACPSCGSDWSAFKTEIGLYVRPPGIVLDVSEAAVNPRWFGTPRHRHGVARHGRRYAGRHAHP